MVDKNPEGYLRSKGSQPHTRFKNKLKKKRLRRLWDNFNHTNIQIIRVPEGKNKEEEIKNLSEK